MEQTLTNFIKVWV